MLQHVLISCFKLRQFSSYFRLRQFSNMICEDQFSSLAIIILVLYGKLFPMVLPLNKWIDSWKDLSRVHRWAKWFSCGTKSNRSIIDLFLIELQYMRFSCRGGARLMTQGDERSPSSWYATRSDKHGLQWGDAPPYSRMCSCATNGTCLHNR